MEPFLRYLTLFFRFNENSFVEIDMKKLIALFAVLLMTSFAFAQACHNGAPGYCDRQPSYGYTGNASTTTVKAALGMPDDTPVTLKGKITKSLGNERYLFTDSTGSIQVEIDQKVFYRSQVQVSSDDFVEISGEVDKEWNKTEIEVKFIKKL